MFSGAELVKASDIQYRDLGKIESEAFSRSYVEEIVRERFGHSPRKRDLDAAIKESLDDLSSGRVFVLVNDPFSPALHFVKNSKEKEKQITYGSSYYKSSYKSAIQKTEESSPLYKSASGRIYKETDTTQIASKEKDDDEDGGRWELKNSWGMSHFFQGSLERLIRTVKRPTIPRRTQNYQHPTKKQPPKPPPPIPQRTYFVDRLRWVDTDAYYDNSWNTPWPVKGVSVNLEQENITKTAIETTLKG